MKYTKMHSKIYLATTVLHKSAFIERKFRYILKNIKKIAEDMKFQRRLIHTFIS